MSSEIEELQKLSEVLAVSSLLPAPLRQKSADIFVILLIGKELGLQPMASVRSLKIIQGTPTLSADGLAALVRASGKCERLECVELSAEKCTYLGKRSDSGAEESHAFTMADAIAAGLGSNTNYKRFPKAMLRARAHGNLPRHVAGCCRRPYDPEEIQPDVQVITAVAQSAQTVQPAPATQQPVDTAQKPGVAMPATPTTSDVMTKAVERTISVLGGTVQEPTKQNRVQIVDAAPGEAGPATQAPPANDVLVAAGELKGASARELSMNALHAAIEEISQRCNEAEKKPGPKPRWIAAARRNEAELRRVLESRTSAGEVTYVPDDEEVPF